MDIGLAFTFVFDDEEWVKKVAIGGGIAIAGVILSPVLLIGLLLLLPLYGYMVEVLKNVRDEHENPLPNWDNFGSLFKTGFFVVLIWIVYHLPAGFFLCSSTSLRVLPLMVELDADAAGAIGFIGYCLGCIQFLLFLVATIIFPAGLIRYAQDETFGSAFQFGEIFSFIQDNVGDYIIVILLGLVASTIASFGFILCVVGMFFTTFWATLVKGHLLGQLVRTSQIEAT